jgi:hypothetical protein
MKEKLIKVGETLKDMASKAIGAAPLCAGIAIGYIGHPAIKMLIGMTKLILRGILSL